MSNLELYERWKKEAEEVGEQRGEKRGLAEGEKRAVAVVGRQFERRLGRVLTDGEHTVLRQRLDTLVPARLGDAVLDLEVTALSDWIKDPAAK